MKLLVVVIVSLVLDYYTKEPLVGVKISTPQETVYTDLNGKFSLNVDSVRVSYISYVTEMVKNDSVIYLKPQ